MTRRIPVWLTAMLAWCGAVSPSGVALAVPPLPCRYAVSQIIQGPPLGGEPSATACLAMNADGVVCGYYKPVGFGADRAFYWSEATGFVSIHPPGFTVSHAWDISDKGLIAGDAGDLGFIYNIHTGERRFVSAPDGGSCGASAINTDGVACGSRSIDDGGEIGHPQNAFVWMPDGQVIDLGVMIGTQSKAWDIADDGTVVGWTGVASYWPGTRPFVWQNGKLQILDIPQGAMGSSGWGVSNRRFVLLQTLESNNPYVYRATLWNGTEFFTLPIYPGANMTLPVAIGAQGQVLTIARDATQFIPDRAVIWHDGIMVNLNDLLLDDTEVYFHDAKEMLGDGRVLCGGWTYETSVGVILFPVPGVPSDSNCDQQVDVMDLLRVIGNWGPCEACNEDFNEDRIVNVHDLLEVIVNWTF